MNNVCTDCGEEEALPEIDVGPLCLDSLRRSGDDADRERVATYERALLGKDDPDLVVE